MKKNVLIALFAAAFALTGCNATKSADAAKYEQIKADVVAKHKQAKELGFIWYQKKMKKGQDYAAIPLAKAEEAAKAGDYAKATKLAKAAQEQVDLMLGQYNDEIKNGGYKYNLKKYGL